MTKPDPNSWSNREWLAFLLLSAAYADGVMDLSEDHLLNMRLGKDVVRKMQDLYLDMSPEQREGILKEHLPRILGTRRAKENLQRQLHDLFLVDGEYGPEEQRLLRQISAWVGNQRR